MHKIFRQYRIKGIGTFINVLYLTAPLLGIGMYFINATTFYAVVNTYIHNIVPWLSFPIFLIFMVIGVLVMVFLFFILVYSGYQAFQNQQVYKHDNPIKPILDAHTKDLALIKKALKIDEPKQE